MQVSPRAPEWNLAVENQPRSGRAEGTPPPFRPFSPIDSDSPPRAGRGVSLPKDWAEELLKMAEKDFNNSAPSLVACVKESETKLSVISQKLERLLTGYLDQVIDEQDYRTEKSKLLLSKKSLQEEMTSLSHKQNDWLAPFQNWLKDAQSLDKIASDSDLFAKKVCAKEIFGSHLLLGEKTVRAAEGDAPNSFGKMGGNQWAALCAAHNSVSEKPLSSILVRGRGLAPPRLAAYAPQAYVYTISPPAQI